MRGERGVVGLDLVAALWSKVNWESKHLHSKLSVDLVIVDLFAVHCAFCWCMFWRRKIHLTSDVPRSGFFHGSSLNFKVLSVLAKITTLHYASDVCFPL